MKIFKFLLASVTSAGPDSRSSRVTSGLTDLERTRSDSEFESAAGDNVKVVVRYVYFDAACSFNKYVLAAFN